MRDFLTFFLVMQGRAQVLSQWELGAKKDRGKDKDKGTKTSQKGRKKIPRIEACIY